MTKWKKFDFLRFDGGCFSKCALPIPGATLKNEPSKFDLLKEKRKRGWVVFFSVSLTIAGIAKFFPKIIRSFCHQMRGSCHIQSVEIGVEY
jgi:hypothetical protein